MIPERLMDIEILRMDYIVALERKERTLSFAAIVNERRTQAARRTEMAVS